MNILDDLEEYSKLISNVGVGCKKDEVDGKLHDINNELVKLKDSHEKLKESHEIYKVDVDSRISQLCIDAELQRKEHNNLSDSNKLNNEALLKELNELKEYRQNMEDYKKVTNDRIEKLVKLFLSINK
jgi:hypothetical protein